jgi:hypothetical protein
MPTNYKVLGQSAPTDTNNANMYTVPSATQAVVSTITVSNTTGSSAVGRIFIRVGGAAAAASNAVVYDTIFAGNSVTALTLGITIGATDVISVRSSVANALTFQAFGSEIS